MSRYLPSTNSPFETILLNFPFSTLPIRLKFDILSETLVDKIIPISEEIKKLLKDQSYLDSILLNGVENASKIASKKIKNIKEIVGF